ncbi:MAG: hypothetical protein LBD60_00435 [Puniceicoccales bacterium]|nr:hypothetical protein [Puniceicoccales bacterium]
MDIKKIIGMGVLCGLSFDGSATVCSRLSTQYPVRYSTGSYQGCGLPLRDCFGEGDCAALENQARIIIDDAKNLAGPNATDGAILCSISLIGAWRIYNYIKAHPEIADTLRRANNGALSLAEKREFQKYLKQCGEGIAGIISCPNPDSYLPYCSRR